MHVLLAEIFGIFLAKDLVEVLSGIGDLLWAAEHDGEVGYVDNALKVWHLLIVELCGHHVAHEEKAGIGMVYHVVDLSWGEFVLDRNGHGSIGERGQESACPHWAVATAKGDLVAFLQAYALKHDVELLYLARHVVVLQCGTLIVGKGVFIPVVDDGVLNQLIQTSCICHCTKFGFPCKVTINTAQ